MKKLALVLMLMSGVSFAHSIYCPASVLCTAKVCDDVPDDFYISSSYFLNVQYVFSNAAVISGLNARCTYVNDRKRLVLTSKKPLLPDQSIDDNRWYSLAGPMSGMYACEFFAQLCPFVTPD